MLVSLRSAVLVFAALSASSVAPAKVGPSAEPLLPVPSIPLSDEVLPLEVVGEDAIVPDSDSGPVDELAPLTAIPARPTGDLASMVAQLRSSDPGSRELECL